MDLVGGLKLELLRPHMTEVFLAATKHLRALSLRVPRELLLDNGEDRVTLGDPYLVPQSEHDRFRKIISGITTTAMDKARKIPPSRGR